MCLCIMLHPIYHDVVGRFCEFGTGAIPFCVFVSTIDIAVTGHILQMF